MSSTESAKVFDLLNAAFPEIRCLRCGHDQFLATTDVDALGASEQGGRSKLALQNALAYPESGSRVLTLACMRCGHLEQHLTGLLSKARHPISVESASDDKI